jgi:hypothetical protein
MRLDRAFQPLVTAVIATAFVACSAPEPQAPAAEQPAKATHGPVIQIALDGGQVNPDNFRRAETDMYFTRFTSGKPLGQLTHERELTPIEAQVVVRSNRDTYYSSGVFDLEAGPLTVTLPEPQGRFQSMLVIDQDHYVVDVAHGAGARTYTREQVGTRYVMVLIRTFVDPANAADVKTAHALQDAIVVDQPGGPGTFTVPQWDSTSHATVRTALGMLGSTYSDFSHAFGKRDEVDPVRHLIGTAAGWGGNPDHEAIYRNAVPERNDGTTVHRLHVDQVPVDGFWSISVYNAKGFFEPNALNAYSLNNITAQKNADGSIDIQFGGCDGKVPNCLPITAGWNYTVRLYQPRKELLDGTWAFPAAEAVR